MSIQHFSIQLTKCVAGQKKSVTRRFPVCVCVCVSLTVNSSKIDPLLSISRKPKITVSKWLSNPTITIVLENRTGEGGV